MIFYHENTLPYTWCEKMQRQPRLAAGENHCNRLWLKRSAHRRQRSLVQSVEVWCLSHPFPLCLKENQECIKFFLKKTLFFNSIAIWIKRKQWKYCLFELPCFAFTFYIAGEHCVESYMRVLGKCSGCEWAETQIKENLIQKLILKVVLSWPCICSMFSSEKASNYVVYWTFSHL